MKKKSDCHDSAFAQILTLTSVAYAPVDLPLPADVTYDISWLFEETSTLHLHHQEEEQGRRKPSFWDVKGRLGGRPLRNNFHRFLPCLQTYFKGHINWAK